MDEKKAGARMPGGVSLPLSEMVQYQEDAIVSRILYQDDIGTFTVFAFDEGQALSEHTVPFDAFVQVLDGKAVLTIGGEKIAVAAGELARMPGGVPHQVDAPERFKMLLTLFRAKKK